MPGESLRRHRIAVTVLLLSLTPLCSYSISTTLSNIILIVTTLLRIQCFGIRNHVEDASKRVGVMFFVRRWADVVEMVGLSHVSVASSYIILYQSV